MGLKVAVAKIRKAVAAAAATAIVGVVGQWVAIDASTLEVVIDALVVAVVVWSVPNSKDVFDA